MKTNNQNNFQEQLKAVIRKYPNLAIKEKNGCNYLKGILDIYNDKFEVVGNFLVEIHYKEGFPFRFPTLYEVGGIIPHHPDWHKYNDGSCCITVEPAEILKCKHGITVLEYIEQQAIPFLANFIHRKVIGFYKNGEYSHGPSGLVEFYSGLLKTSDRELWVKYFKYTFRNENFDDSRNKLCFCGSNKKYKRCHLMIFETFQSIGELQVLKDFKNIIK